jgi:type IV pilus assembly protein PilQ
VKRDLGLSGILGAAAIVMIAQPASASPAQITNVQVEQTQEGAQVVLSTRNGDRPQVFTVNRGNALVADIINTQLQLPEGNGFLQNNPAPGIASVSVTQLDANSVRVVITGATDPPSGEISTRPNGVVLNVMPMGGVAAAPEVPAVPEAPAPTPDLPAEPPPPSTPDSTAQAPDSPLASPLPNSDVLIPDPGITIDGIPVLQPSQGYVPPTLPAPVPPPIGDIATSSLDTSPPEVNLGTSEIVPRLVLRDAPVRDVLSLLARAAGLNVAYIGDDTQEVPGEPGAEIPDVRISLDIENEPVQNVFNYVIRIAGLDVNRVGRTIFVGPRLPNTARQLIARTLRLNQIDVPSALNFLVGLGAETSVSRERLVTSVSAVPVATAVEGGTSAITQTQTTTEDRIEVQRVDYQDSVPLLRGLQVTGDERTNSVTLVGNPRQIEVAAAQLAQLDVRRRQTAVNVRVIDVNLLGIDRVSTSFSFGIDDTRVIQDGGVGIINFGTAGNSVTPAGVPGTAEGVVGQITPAQGPAAFNFIRNFLAQLQFAVTSGNAKILTDPTLVVQEGQTAEVQLTRDVVVNFSQEITTTDQTSTVTLEAEREPAGLILQVQVNRIDDNGFISMSVAPSISAPVEQITVQLAGQSNEITLLSERRLSSGLVRIRDGQTLILSGIIEDRDRVDVTKVPILGDIPILGALFRSTTRENERREVIVLVTPHIIDDSDTATFGYRYTPTNETQQYLQEQNIQLP